MDFLQWLIFLFSENLKQIVIKKWVKKSRKISGKAKNGKTQNYYHLLIYLDKNSFSKNFLEFLHVFQHLFFNISLHAFHTYVAEK